MLHHSEAIVQKRLAPFKQRPASYYGNRVKKRKEKKKGRLLTWAGNEMITTRRWSGCQGVIDLDSSQSSSLFRLLGVDKSKQENVQHQKKRSGITFVSPNM